MKHIDVKQYAHLYAYCQEEEHNPLLKLTSIFPALCILVSTDLGNMQQHFLMHDFALYFFFFLATIIIYLKCLVLITVTFFHFCTDGKCTGIELDGLSSSSIHLLIGINIDLR